MRVRLLVAVAVLILIVPAALALFSPSKAQQAEWTWPEKSKNLKQLPKDTDKAKLRAVMTGFTRSLGVRCSYCHVGKEGEPLSTYDFASDENPKKEIARGMLKMLGSVNEQVNEIRGANVQDPVSVGCNTCHHGVPRPRTLVEELELTYDKTGADSTVAKYRTLRERYDNAGVYDFREGSLNLVGYHALQKKDVPGAVALFKLNVESYPGSANVHDSLGEAYLAAKDTALAIAEYERSFAIDPKNDNAENALKTLRK